MTPPLVSVITVTYNHRHIIGISLKRLLNASPHTIETIVVDNASTDGTADYIEQHFAHLTLIRSDVNGGFSYGCNKGEKAASADYLFFLNPDAWAEPDEILKLVTFLQNHPQVAAAGPKIYRKGEVEYSCRPFPGYSQVLFHRYSLLTKLFPNNPLSRQYLMSDWTHNEPRKVDWISGSALMIRRAIYRELGGFDEGYFLFCEDTDLCKRVWLHGGEVWYVPQATVHHEIGESEQAGTFASLWQRHKSMWRYYLKFHRGNHLKNVVTLMGIGGRFLLYATLLSVRKAVNSRGRNVSYEK